ncbi:MAG: Ig-like domain-containing protein [Anaerolineaceae bacterium]|nr:Ig-like domain-containing protein [Anaerolineaceae bacterium]
MKSRFCALLSILFLAMISSCDMWAISDQEMELPGGQVWIDAPLPGAHLPLEPYMLVFHAASQNGISDFEVQVNGVLIGTVPPVLIAPGNGQTSLFHSENLWEPLEPGTYLISVTAKDSSGNPGEPALVRVSIGYQRPSETPTQTPGTATPTLTSTLSASMTATQTEEVTPTYTTTATLEGLIFNVEVSEHNIFYGGCEPRQTMFNVEVSNPEGVANVMLFTRIQNQSTSERTEWGAGVFTMNTLGEGSYRLPVVIDTIPDYDLYLESILEYQLVAVDSDNEVLGRSMTFSDIFILPCGSPPPAGVPTYSRPTSTPRRAP